MKDLLRRPLVIASIAGTVALLVVWWLAWMTPESHKLNGIRQTEAQDQELVVSLRGQLATLQAEAKVVRASSPFLSRFAGAIPAAPNAPALVVDLYRLATKTGVSLQSVTDDVVSPGTTGYSTMPVSISVSGGHDAVISFVAGIYKLPRLLTIQSFGLSGTGNVNSPGAAPYTAAIAATAYTTTSTANASATSN